ncbi:stage II sporulation protein M [Nocardioides jishulii]|uniref:Stage II sporulation protein M n=1 Tax=Nocardioides jishulii TaxID=2575440 RepID=A0A4U2YT71_9ACTN|nr:stage II sporulation protein M [Nocardioides jishulii]QCX28429.1 stage II sporulation protein M [Nocardioides jishulii]TKI64678.1 stage II sporulation protein M [Nocardioides jishulii]
MDLDAYVVAHRAEWARLNTLTRRRRLTGAEADELADLYQQVGTHLSAVRAQSPDPALVQHLSVLLTNARSRALASRTSTVAGVAYFFTHRFPAALYRLRYWWLGALVGNVVVAGLMMWWLYHHPSVEQSMMSQEQIDALVAHDFENYYTEPASSHFAAQVWVNNAWVSALCIALGILGVPVFWLLFQNIANLAVIGAIMHRYDHGAHFWGLLLPHGLLELTAVFVAAGTGLRLFWSWIEPKDLTRARSIAREGRTAATIALGLVVVLLVSGVIEGFVTPSGLPTWGRLAIGVLAEVVFFGYVFVVGRRAAAQGEDGDVDARHLEDRVASRA